MKTKPSDFTNKPFASVFRKSESETIARNIMVILSRTGNEFRELSWDEYKKERLKDGEFSESEKGYFEKVLPYCVSAEMAARFSDSWTNKTESDDKV